MYTLYQKKKKAKETFPDFYRVKFQPQCRTLVLIRDFCLFVIICFTKATNILLYIKI